MMTAQIWIDETRDMLLSGYVEELLLVGAPAVTNATSTAFTVSEAANSGIVKGVVIEINEELMYVTSVDGTTVNVLRGYGGSTASSTGHSVDSIVRVSPKFPAHRIIDAINHDLRDLSAPNSGLFQMLTTSFTYNAPVDGYNMLKPDGVTPLTSEEVQSIYSVTYAEVGVEAREPAVSSWKLKRNRDTATFSSGMALILYGAAWPGKKVTVSYKSPFTAISDATTPLSDVGLPTTAYDLPPLGAAMALMPTRPIRREFLDAEGTSRMAEEVPPGAISASFRDLMGRRRARLEAEAARLATMYPQNLKDNSSSRPVGNWGRYWS